MTHNQSKDIYEINLKKISMWNAHVTFVCFGIVIFFFWQVSKTIHNGKKIPSKQTIIFFSSPVLESQCFESSDIDNTFFVNTLDVSHSI